MVLTCYTPSSDTQPDRRYVTQCVAAERLHGGSAYQSDNYTGNSMDVTGMNSIHV